jgi:predicted metalloprotease
MRWRPSSQTQVEDRRGEGGMSGGLGGRFGGLGGGGIPIPVGGGLGGIVLFVIIIVVLNLMGGPSGATGSLQGAPGGAIASLSPGDNQAQFINAVTVDVQTFWGQELSATGTQYPQTVLVLFSGQTQTGCGVASAQTGPFYCPSDQKVYLDSAFFDELHTRFGAPGDFAEAYVIAHVFGHTVQDVLGTMDQVAQQQQAGSDPGGANGLSVRLELQADCFAGIWANSVWSSPDQANVESITQPDVNDALGAAAAVGDDRIQEQATGTIDKESWTHGSSTQRAKWFNAGFKTGSIDSCGTFAAATP